MMGYCTGRLLPSTTTANDTVMSGPAGAIRPSVRQDGAASLEATLQRDLWSTSPHLRRRNPRLPSKSDTRAPVQWPAPANPLHHVSAALPRCSFKWPGRSRHRCSRSEPPVQRARRQRLPGQYPSSAEFREGAHEPRRRRYQAQRSGLSRNARSLEHACPGPRESVCSRRESPFQVRVFRRLRRASLELRRFTRFVLAAHWRP